MTQEEQDQCCAACELESYIDRIGLEYDEINTFSKTAAYQLMQKYKNIVLCQECAYRIHEETTNADYCRLGNGSCEGLKAGDGCSFGKRKE